MTDVPTATFNSCISHYKAVKLKFFFNSSAKVTLGGWAGRGKKETRAAAAAATYNYTHYIQQC